MRFACLILLAALASPAHARNEPPGGAGDGGPRREVSTVRSDGALYSGARQRVRRERARTSDITLSRRNQRAPGAWQGQVEPPGGGERQTPAGDGDSNTIPLLIGVDVGVNDRRQNARPERSRGHHAPAQRPAGN